MALLDFKKGTKLTQEKVPIKDGQLLFETDTKKIWLDDGTARLQMGGADTINMATPSSAGLMSAVDKTSLNNLVTLVGDTPVSDQIDDVIANLGTITIDITDADSGAVPYTNADQLGGKAASEYLGVSDTAVNSLNSEKLGGKAPQYYIQPRNLLDNSDFTNPVNQRGQSSYTKGYTIDRWQVSGNLGTLELTDKGVKITRTDSQNTMKFVNPIPLTEIKKDKIYTLAVCDNGSILLFSSAFPAQNDTVEVSGGAVSVEFAKAESCYVLRICIHDVNAQHVFEWAALYEGEYTSDTLPPYVPKGYAAEKLECQRYYLPLSADPFFNGQTYESGGGAWIQIPTPTKMRAIPTLNIGGGTMKIRCNGTDTNITSYDVYSIYENQVVLRVQGSFSSKQACASYITNSTTTPSLSADL